MAEVDIFGDLLDAIFGHKDWRPGMSYVLDHSDLDASNITSDKVLQIAALAKLRRARAGVTRSAIVAPRDLEFGLSRMWSVFIDDEDNVATGIFRTAAEAIDWVSA